MAERIPPEDLAEGLLGGIKRFLFGLPPHEKDIVRAASKAREQLVDMKPLLSDLKTLMKNPDDKVLLKSVADRLGSLSRSLHSDQKDLDRWSGVES